MPCNVIVDDLTEKHSRDAEILYEWLCDKELLPHTYPNESFRAGFSAVEELCHQLKLLGDDKLKEIVIENIDDDNVFKLMGWWEYHKTRDARDLEKQKESLLNSVEYQISVSKPAQSQDHRISPTLQIIDAHPEMIHDINNLLLDIYDHIESDPKGFGTPKHVKMAKSDIKELILRIGFKLQARNKEGNVDV